MKRLLILLTVFLGTLTAHADDYAYLTFELTDGERVSVPVSSLTITFSGTTLTAGSQTFTLSNLSKMYFSNSEETTAIEASTISDWNEVTEIYDLNGRRVTKDQMRRGVYVVKSKSGTHKIAVK